MRVKVLIFLKKLKRILRNNGILYSKSRLLLRKINIIPLYCVRQTKNLNPIKRKHAGEKLRCHTEEGGTNTSRLGLSFNFSAESRCVQVRTLCTSTMYIRVILRVLAQKRIKNKRHERISAVEIVSKENSQYYYIRTHVDPIKTSDRQPW